MLFRSKAYELESSWMHYILGHAYSKEVTDATVAYFIKKRQAKIGMYDHEADKYGFGFETPLVKKLNNRSSGNDTRTNFFEGKVTTYSKQELSWEEFTGMGDAGMEWTNVTQQTFEEAVKEKGTQKVDIEDRSGKCVVCK